MPPIPIAPTPASTPMMYPASRRDPVRPSHVTLRLAGSIPGGALGRLRAVRDAAAPARPCRGGEAEAWLRRIDPWLDAGHGPCWFRQAPLARAMVSALTFFDGRRYDLGPWVVMPNHVHVIVRPLAGHSLSEVVGVWARFVALEAQRRLGGGAMPFWEPDCHEVVVSDVTGHVRWTEEIRRDPVAAGLCRTPEDWPWGSAHPDARW